MAKIILNVFSFFFIAFVAFIAAPRPVAAYDDRLVLKWTTAQFATGVDFCNEWDAACKDFHPSDNKDLQYINTVCEPGDYQGKNADTEAKAGCTFWEKGQPQQSETEALATQLRVQLAS